MSNQEININDEQWKNNRSTYEHCSVNSKSIKLNIISKYNVLLKPYSNDIEHSRKYICLLYILFGIDQKSNRPSINSNVLNRRYEIKPQNWSWSNSNWPEKPYLKLRSAITGKQPKLILKTGRKYNISLIDEVRVNSIKNHYPMKI